jgi:hypothetical protein
MCPACKLLPVLLLAIRPDACRAADAVSGPECAAGVCVLNVLAPDLISAPCVGYSVLIAYSESSGATLIQCSKPAGEENKSLIYNRHDRAVKPFEFEGGRFIRPDYLSKARIEGIPDRFGTVPLCPAENRKPAVNGELLIAQKQPGKSDDAPYCFRIYYVIPGKSNIRVRGDDGRDEASGSDEAITEWVPLQKKLARFIGPRHPGGGHE